MKNTWEEFILSEPIVEYPKSDPSDRQIRSIISKLRKQGIIFISVKSDHSGFRKYVRFENATDAQKQEYAAQNLKRLRTLYFNTVLPIKSEIHDEHLLSLMENLQ